MNGSEQETGKGKAWAAGIAITVVVVAGAAFVLPFDSKPAPKKPKPSGLVVVDIPPPLPPAPPPPPPKQETPPPPEENRMIEQQPVVEEPVPDETPAPDEPPSDLGTGIAGDGPGDFGLTHGNGAGGGGKGKGGSGRKAGRFDRQAIGIQNTLLAALKQNAKTRRAVFSGEIRVWADASGRLTRVQLDGSTGDTVADDAIRRDFIGLQFPDVAGVPMPAHIRIKARKPTP